MNFNSPEWKEIESVVQERLTQLDLNNRDRTLNWDETVGLRGEIQSLLWLLEWPLRQEALTSQEQEHGFE